MGTTKRKEREQKAMQKAIVDAARELFLTKGYENTSIRKIANEIDYSPAAIYRYFQSKDDILFTIHTEAFNVFRDHLRDTFSIKDPLDRLQAMGRVYLDFAIKNPELYDLMFILRAPMESHKSTESWDAGMKAYNCLDETVGECIEQGHFKEIDKVSTTLAIWSMVHGIASLLIRDRLHMYPEEHLQEIMQTALDNMVIKYSS